MKKLLIPILAAALLLPAPMFAQQIRSIETHVYIDGEGDALIRQTWDVNVVSGTEWYIPIGNLGDMQIRGLEVSENGQTFIDEGRSWNSNRSLLEKEGRSGIIEKKDGVELCWGQGSIGDHVWKVQYVTLGLVQSLEDYDAFNYMFVNPDLVAAPQKVSVVFHKLDGGPFESDSTRFWFFGTEGFSHLGEDGTIQFDAENLRRSDSVIGMMRFEKGVFSPHVTRKMKFEKMQKKAFRGSSYQTEKKKGFLSGMSMDDLIDFFFQFLMILVAGGYFVFMGLVWIRDRILKATGRQWKKETFGATKIDGWEREAPFGGSIPAAAALLKDGSRLNFKDNDHGKRMGAYFLKWINEGIVTPVKAADGHYDVQFPSVEPDFSSSSEKSLYQKAFSAAGENLILEKGEFDSWAKQHYKSMTGWPDALVSEGRAEIAKFSGNKVEEAAKLLKFKNFLNDFTLSKVREVPEVGLWGQYLVFAQIFGIADKVASGFAKMFPEQFEQFSQTYGLDTFAMRDVVRTWNTNANHAFKSAYSEKLSQEAAARSSASGSSGGFGGYSSRGGGGGFSGGGRGGGSR